MRGNHSRADEGKQARPGGERARVVDVSRFRRPADLPPIAPARCSPSGVSLTTSDERCPFKLSASVPAPSGIGQAPGRQVPTGPLAGALSSPFEAGRTHDAACTDDGASTDLRGAWIDLLGRWPWDLFGNHTFREDVHPEAAFKAFRLFISMLNRKLYGPRWHKRGKGIRWVCAMERQARGVVHFHSLLASPELVELLKSSWSPDEEGRWQNEVLELWNSLAGFARIEPIKNDDLVRGYVSKYVVKGGEIELGGPGMPEYQWAGHPARVDRRWITTEVGRASAMARIRRVVTDAELSAMLGCLQEQRFTWRGSERVNVLSTDRRRLSGLVGAVRARVRTSALNLR